MKKYFKKDLSKIKSALLNGTSIDFNKTISGNNIKDGDIININASKDLNIKSLIKKFSEIEFCLFFTSGHRIKVSANPNDCFKSILKKYFNEENINKFKSGLLNGRTIDFNQSISENQIENGNTINLIASKDFNIIPFVKKFSEIEFSFTFTNGETRLLM